MIKPIIEVKNISKRYWITPRDDTLRDSITNFFKKKQKPELLWALKDISFDVMKGEIIGFIGPNGAGKSTLLKILSRITPPTNGEIRMRGRVASLLEVGTGFHQELTGYENIYLNGSILGMKKKEIDRKLDEIVKFSGVEDFLNTPVKRFSSGMFVRLAFSVAAHLEPEILLVDEVLAVGDAQFRKKCLNKMKDVTESGRTILFVSHDMSAISNLCEKVYFLDKGEFKAAGDPEEVIAKYFESFTIKTDLSLAERTDRSYSGDIRFTDIRVLDAKSKKEVTTVLSGENILIELSYESKVTSRELKNVNVTLKFITSQGQVLSVLVSQQTNRAFETLPPQGKIYCYIPQFPLSAGSYSIASTLTVKGVRSDHFRSALTFDVEGGDFYGTGFSSRVRSRVFIPHSWKLDKESDIIY